LSVSKNGMPTASEVKISDALLSIPAARWCRHGKPSLPIGGKLSLGGSEMGERVNPGFFFFFFFFFFARKKILKGDQQHAPPGIPVAVHFRRIDPSG